MTTTEMAKSTPAVSASPQVGMLFALPHTLKEAEPMPKHVPDSPSDVASKAQGGGVGVLDHPPDPLAKKGRKPKPRIDPFVIELASDTPPPPHVRRTRIPKRLPTDPLVFCDTFTPEQAANILRWRNPYNRARREAFIKSIAEDMAGGEFLLNGATICFDVDGNLLDGQNRLNACVRTGKPFRTVVVEELPRMTQGTMDAGAARNLAADLEIRGETNVHVLAATLRRAIVWQHAVDTSDDKTGNYVGRSNWRPSKQQQLHFFDSDPEAFRESAHMASWVYQRLAVPTACLGFCHWLLVQFDEEETNDMYEALRTGIFKNMHNAQGPVPGEPLYELRETLNFRLKSPSRTTELHYAALIVKAFIFHMQGRRIQKLSFAVGGKNPEQFPQPQKAAW